ncbi:NAD(P)-binding protein [Aureobasidium subglaciale]|nr:NAD(P)-binding protein [Aureobasidium subglaciale]
MSFIDYFSHPTTAHITNIASLLTPSFLALISIVTILYTLTLSPLPSTPALSIDYLLHLMSFLFPPIQFIWSCALGSHLSYLAIAKTPSYLPFTLATWYTLLYSLSAINTRLGNGKARKLVWSQQIAVITGGAGGLGWLVAKILELKGTSVAVWDVKAPEELEREEGGVKWYRVDVTDVQEVEMAWQRVKDDLGTPTILINNAGIVNGLPLLSLTATQYTRCFAINTLSHFHTTRTFLPSMLSSPLGGTIVTVSSVLGHLGASHLTDYTASKAALLAFHTSLGAEISQLSSSPQHPGAKNMRMLLVKPGQLSTAMFSTLKSPSDFFGPVVQAKDLAKAIVDGIEEGRDGVVAMPVYAHLVEWLGVLPTGLQRAARWMSGVDGAMKTFGSKRE